MEHHKFNTEESEFFIYKYFLPLVFIFGTLAMFALAVYLVTVYSTFEENYVILIFTFMPFLVFFNLLIRNLVDISRLKIFDEYVEINNEKIDWSNVVKIRQIFVTRIDIYFKKGNIIERVSIPPRGVLKEFQNWPEDFRITKFLKSKIELKNS